MATRIESNGDYKVSTTLGSTQAPVTETPVVTSWVFTNDAEPGMMYITGGTVTAITITRGNNAAITTGLIAGSFYLAPYDILTVANTVVPTAIFVPC